VGLPPALRRRDFRLFVAGSFLSAVGTQLTTVAMAWQIYLLTDSALQVGLLGLARAVPQIAGALVGGMIADAFDRRRVLAAVQVGSAVVAAGLALLTLVGQASPTVLLAAAVLFALGTAVETPSRQAVVPSLVASAELAAAIALNNTQRSVATILGPSLAGVALAIYGPAACYAVDAASRLAMVVALALIARPRPGRAIAIASLDALVAGVRFVRHQPVILSFMLLDFGATFFGTSSALLPIYARDILDTGPVGLGLLYAAPSIGALVAGTAMSTVVRVERAGRWVLLGVALYALCTIGFALSSTLWLSVAMLAGTGLGNMVSAVLRGTSNQLLTPDHLRGRVAAVNSVFVQGGPQLGQFEGGLVAALGGARLSALTGGLGALLLVGAIALIPEVRRFRLPGRVEEEPASAAAAAPAAVLLNAPGRLP
jgi:MFS family permease